MVMKGGQYAVVLLFLLSGVHSRHLDDNSYCESWKFTVETGDIGAWKSEIPTRCLKYVKEYVTGKRYLSDSEFVTAESMSFANNVTLIGDGKDCWVFDIDETLLSNLPYYKETGYWTKTFNQTSYNEWTLVGVMPVLPASLRLYNHLKKLNFTTVLLTGRSESYRKATRKNLIRAGYTNWGKLILRGASDEGKKAIVYKSKKRQELVDEGYTIHGCSGDQWSDLRGNATGTRSFKVPNPMYYVG